jgi:1-acyl-sn-glycerol-3-phosphate acyltransferase
MPAMRSRFGSEALKGFRHPREREDPSGSHSDLVLPIYPRRAPVSRLSYAPRSLLQGAGPSMIIPLPNSLRVPLAAVLSSASTIVHVPAVLVVALFKALLPVRPIRRVLDTLLIKIAESWIGFNSWMIRTFTHTRFVVEGEGTWRNDGHYLLMANHQSWVDIPALQMVFNRRIPFVRFFLKQQLIWVPLLGLAWWALDFPFMKRYSRETLAKRPELAGRDVEATRKACEKFRHIPVSIMNFVEGTRFTPAKHQAQQSPFAHLLKPKAGGVAFVLGAMGDALHAILDITIAYPHGRPSLVDLFGDRIPEIRIHVRELPIPADLIAGDYQNDAAFRERFQAWVNQLWEEKDALLGTWLPGSGVPSASSHKRCS